MNKWLLAVVIILFPAQALASFEQGQKYLLLTSNDAIYRLRKTSQKFQLSEYHAGSVHVFGEKIITTNGGQVLSSDDGLSYQEVLKIASSPDFVRVFQDHLLVYVDSESSVFVAGQDLKFMKISGQYRARDFYEIDKKLFYVSSYDPLVIEVLVENVWQQVVSSDEGVETIYGWNDGFAGISSNTTELYFWNGRLNIYDLLEVPTLMKVVGRRAFIDFASGWKEVDLNTGEITPPICESTCEIIGSDDGGAAVVLGASSYFTAKFKSYHSVVIPITFTNFITTSNGFLYYQAGGSKTYFAVDHSVFNQNISPWSASSKIAKVVIWDGRAYLELYNSANNLNYYVSTGYISWNRLSLPTKTTRSMSIAQARQALPGDLVEVSGYQSIKPGLVSSNVIYLQDNEAGIQLYLSSSSGNLPSILGRKYLVDGEISGGQNSRIILDSPEDLSYLGETDSLKWLDVNLDELTNYRGRLVRVSGLITETNTSSFTLASSIGSALIHFGQANDLVATGDTLRISGVADWSSHSKAVDLWYDQNYLSFLSRYTEPVADEDDSLATFSVPTNQVDRTTLVSTIKEVPIVIQSSRANSTATEESADLSIWPILGLSLIVGILIGRGSKFTPVC